MSKPLAGPIQPGGGGETPAEAARREMLDFIEKFKQIVRTGRGWELQPGDPVPNWNAHEQQLAEMERLIRSGTRADILRFADLQSDFLLAFNADAAAVMAKVQARMVRFFDDFSARVEEKKFEIGSDEREQLDEIIGPYQDGIREQMLGELPIDERRVIEEEARRRREEE